MCNSYTGRYETIIIVSRKFIQQKCRILNTLDEFLYFIYCMPYSMLSYQQVQHAASVVDPDQTFPWVLYPDPDPDPTVFNIYEYVLYSFSFRDF
jgi:hypothetical protein